MSAPAPVRAGLAFGANLGDPAAQIARAIDMLRARGAARIVRLSSLWRTPPWGLTDQPAFLNACAIVDTTLAPRQLLDAVKAVERDVGRTAGRRWGPRMIDVDILFHGDAAVDEPGLVVPHPRLFERGFVLAPLAEIAPDLIIQGRDVAQALAQVDRSGIEIADADWPARPREDDMGETIQLTCADGATISAYRARPAGAPKGGMVVLQEIFGVNHHIRAVADRYAAEGYLAVAPALFDRVEKGVELGYAAADMGPAMEIRGRTKIDDTLADIAAAVACAGEGGKVGVVGYCWGGSLAWVAAARLPVAAAVGYYGGAIAQNVSLTPRVPTMLHFGAQDKHIPLTDVEAIRKAHPDVPVHVYDADHGFNCDERASYDKASADLARERTLAFFAKAMG